MLRQANHMDLQKRPKCTKALFELSNHCTKTIDKKNLTDQSVIKAAIFARSSFLQSAFDNDTFFMADDTVDVVIITTNVTE